MMLPGSDGGPILWLLLVALASRLCPSDAVISRNISDFPRPSAATARICGPGYGMFICDPDRLFVSDRHVLPRLMIEMRRLRDRTPCFCTGCNPNGSQRTLVLGLVAAERIYIPPNVTNRKSYLRRAAHALRLHWALGQCPRSENDALILYDKASDEIVYSFGHLVGARLGSRCVRRIENYPRLLAFESRLIMAVNVLRNAARNPCCSNSCLYLNINWYKMLAWVCGGLVLLSALTFVGRRMWSRNLYIRTRPGRGPSSLGGATAGPFGGRARIRNGGHRSSSRPRSTGSFADGDIPQGGAHVLYNSQSPPPYPGLYPGTVGVMQAPPYAGKPPAYSEVAVPPCGLVPAAANQPASVQPQAQSREQPGEPSV